VAVASAGPYANLHLALDMITMPATHHSIFLQAGCPSCHPTNSVKALKEISEIIIKTKAGLECLGNLFLQTRGPLEALLIAA